MLFLSFFYLKKYKVYQLLHSDWIIYLFLFIYVCINWQGLLKYKSYVDVPGNLINKIFGISFSCCMILYIPICFSYLCKL